MISFTITNNENYKKQISVMKWSAEGRYYIHINRISQNIEDLSDCLKIDKQELKALIINAGGSNLGYTIDFATREIAREFMDSLEMILILRGDIISDKYPYE